MTTVYIDYETFLIQPGCVAPPPVCLVYAIDFGAPKLVHAHFDGMFALLEGWLRDPDVTLVAHHAVFEVLVTLAARPEWVSLLFEKLRAGKIKCTLIREKLIRIARGDPREGFGLDACLDAWRIPIALDKASYWRPRFGTLYDKPCSEWPEEARAYVLGDIAVRDLFLAQETAGPAILYDHAAQLRGATPLALTSARGFLTDPQAAQILYDETVLELEEHKKVVFEAGLARYQKKAGELVLVKDKKAAEARLVAAYEASGREPPRGKVTEKMADKGVLWGNVKLDEEACALSGDSVLESYTAYSQAGTLLAKVRRLQRSPIQASYNVLVDTGRTSCRQGDDPEDGEAWTSYGMNLQNMPRKEGTRECFIARPGWAIVSVDMDAFEMRTMAQVALWVLGYSDLADILNDTKRCPHVEMGARLRNIPTADAYALKGKERSNLRGLAKGPNFGLWGGMAYLRLKDYCRLNYGVVLTDDEAKHACKVWREMYREAQPYLDWVKGQVGRTFGSKGTITQFVSKRIRGGVGYTEAANGFFQSLAADIAKAAGWRLVEQAYEVRSSALYGCRPLAFVHDEWLYEIPLDRIHDAGYLMAKIMTDTAHEYCPDVKFTASPAAMLRWSKAAGDPVHDAQGRLIVFEERAK
jgi:hypothetical protein